MTDIVITTILPFVLISVINIMIAYKLKSKSNFNKKNKETVKPNRVTSLSIRQKATLKPIKQSKSFYQSVSKTSNFQPNRIKSVKFNNVLSAVTYKKDSNVTLLIRKSTQIHRTKVYSEATRTLFLISLVFLILHCPLAFNKTLYFLNENLSIKDGMPLPMTPQPEEKLEEVYFVDNSTESLLENINNLETSESEEIFERITCYVFYLSFSLNFFLYNSKAKFRNIILKHFRSTYKNWL